MVKKSASLMLLRKVNTSDAYSNYTVIHTGVGAWGTRNEQTDIRRMELEFLIAEPGFKIGKCDKLNYVTSNFASNSKFQSKASYAILWSAK